MVSTLNNYWWVFEFYLCFLTLGIDEKGKSNCKHVELATLVKNAIPEGYTKSVFCAEDINEDATCRGDSGKHYGNTGCQVFKRGVQN